ncbi:Anti-sigma factor antagonist [Pseudodesulfovibrio profundus]|uniref:Anti-sigma factor antagonist n=1 Tax=Pseudodesulfovibrio profundus TaxID=57320 RepID=A0A2C8FD51_9BACT|nr:STAS domain-containing protein [Pseudodesulfovibrio profundus]MBC16959.1 anti-anti-sigma factor [Desulfovibrio sp.]SOB60417.1 Anti-sigma factor antagonist [Pseudodesulfovibrio profundus]|tara:strand:+ start:12525 stop:12854 length:330 start_codon:yes stop_codon:yes gene_type:complete
MDIVCDKKETGTLVRVNGRLDAVNAPVFEKECMQVVDGGETMMVIDLSDLEYISSAGLRSILSAAKKLKGTGGTMQFCGLTGMVEEVFKVSGLGTMFTVTDTADEAFAS